MLSLTLEFETTEEIVTFIEQMDYAKKCLQKKTHNPLEKRGLHMKELHVLARKKLLENPDMTYKECIQSVSSKI